MRERSTRSGLSEFFWIVECLEILVLFVVVRELTHNIEAIVMRCRTLNLVTAVRVLSCKVILSYLERCRVFDLNRQCELKDRSMATALRSPQTTTMRFNN